MITINKEQDLTKDIIIRAIQDNALDKAKMNKYKQYYDGNQDILNKFIADDTKPCNKVVTNYCADIVDNYNGYLTGKAITYSSDDFDALQDILNMNNIQTEDSGLLRNAEIYGVAYELLYIDEDSKIKMALLNSAEIIPIYSNSVDRKLMNVIRAYHANNLVDRNITYVDVYDDKTIKHYKSDINYSTLELIEEEAHYFNEVPIVVFELNEDRLSIFDKVMSLQDSYNKLLSCEIDDFEAFADAYMVLKGVTADENDLKQMKTNRILLLDEASNAEYLTKSINDTQIQNLLETIKDNIHKIAKSLDFNDEKFMAQSGVAIQYKLVGMENNASKIESNMRKALQKRLELIRTILALTETVSTVDVEITFTRNLPTNTLEIVQMINQLRGVVSDKTLLTQLPFVRDIDKELEQLNTERDLNTNLYAFGGDNNEVLGE